MLARESSITTTSGSEECGAGANGRASLESPVQDPHFQRWMRRMRVAPRRRGESVLDRGRKSESAHMNTAHGMTVLVTGATDGVGRLVAKQVAAAAANVIVNGRNPTKGEQ